jgi:DNA polymerase I-like protein with 3'-5' exonuclease and polymerase domains
MPSANTGYVISTDELSQLAAKVIADGLPIALDCETGYEGEDRGYKNSSPSLHAEEAVLAGFNFTNAVSWARYVPLGHEETRYNLDPVPAARALWDMVSTGLCVVHNADMEERHLSRWLLEYLADDPERGEAVRASRGYFPILSDTMMEAHALARWKHIALKYLSRAVFDYEQVELSDLFGLVLGKPVAVNKKYTLRFNVLDPSDPRVFNYACDDVIQTLRLHQRHCPQVKDNFIYWLEMNVWPVVWGMEDEGLAVDWDYIDEARERTRAFRNKMQAGIVNHLTERLGQLPPKFNPGSHPQVRKVLYNKPDDKDQPGLGLMTHILTKGKKDGSGKKL